MQHCIDFPWNVNVIRNIVLVKTEIVISYQVSDVILAAGDEVVHADDLMSLGQQAVTQVGAQETCGSGDQNSHNTSI